MTPEQRFDRIEGILEQMTVRLEQMTVRQEQMTAHQEQMTARQHYHDEALERHDAQIKALIAASAADGENIRALVRVAEAHQRRLEDLE